ncbi:4Fe-4S binding protein [Aneurinibacillus thermoaerophilus]|jgi:ferredoxin|uniref:DUF362 domain-containing protein n=1 Tax=Aneurinibacillus thermoaerophilus TaxID=143495 RepID=UPI002E237B4F|nr:4Fe-4S binding protein [Aneurinibacillus thermoaerophilus]
MIKIGELCTGCAACLLVCPVSVLSIEKTKAVVSDGCIDCGLCIPACPISVIQFVPKESKKVEEKKRPEPTIIKEESKKGDEVNGEGNTSNSRV